MTPSPQAQAQVMTSTDHAAFFTVVEQLKLAPETMGAAYELCSRAIASQADAYRRAADQGQLVGFFAGVAARAQKTVDREVRSQVLTDATGEGMGAAEGYMDGQVGRSEKTELVREAWRLAHSQAKGRMVDYLAWYERRQRGETASGIAESLDMPAATVRTGIRRAKHKILELTNKLRYRRFARKPGQLPEALEPVVELYKKRDLIGMQAALDELAERFAECPHWNLLQGWLHKADESYEDAEFWMREALVFADVPSVRAKVLNSLGNVYDEMGEPERGRTCWRRAHRLDEDAPVPLLNLLANASERQDLADCQYYITQLSTLRGKGSLSEGEQTFVTSRLEDNPEFEWVRRTSPWRRGPARWIKQAARGAATALAVALLCVMPFVGQGCDDYSAPSAPPAASSCGGAHHDKVVGDVDALVGEIPEVDEASFIEGAELLFLHADGRSVAAALIGPRYSNGHLMAAFELNPMDAEAARGAVSVVVVSGDFMSEPMALTWAGSEGTLDRDGYLGYLALREGEGEGGGEVEDEEERVSKDDYIRPEDGRELKPWVGHEISKDDYIKPSNDRVEDPDEAVGKDDYIHPGEEEGEGGGESGSEGVDEEDQLTTSDALGVAKWAGSGAEEDDYVCTSEECVGAVDEGTHARVDASE